MKKTLLVLVMLLLAIPALYAQDVVVGANWDAKFTLPYPQTGNDFHIEGRLRSLRNRIPSLDNWWVYDHAGTVPGSTKWHMNNMCVSQDPLYPDYWDFSIDFKVNNGHVVFNGATIHFGVEFIVYRANYLKIQKAYWTLDGTNIGSANLIGFHVWEYWDSTSFTSNSALSLQQGDQVVTFLNNTKVPVSLGEIEMAVTEKRVPLEDMFLTGLGASNTVGDTSKYASVVWQKVSGITLDVGDKAEINLKEAGLTLKDGQFLQIRAINKATGTGVWMQHEHFAPVALSSTRKSQ